MARKYVIGYEDVGISEEDKKRLLQIKDADDALRKYLTHLMNDCECKEGDWHLFSLYVMRTPNNGFVISNICLVEVTESPTSPTRKE